MALGDKARAAARMAADARRTAVIGHGVEADDQAYADVAYAPVADLGYDTVESDPRGTDKDPDIPAANREAVYVRSRGEGDVRHCEARASRRCTGRGVYLHHRQLRRSRDHRPENLLDVCVFCHHDIHASPARAYVRGLMVRSTDDPAGVPWQPGLLTM